MLPRILSRLALSAVALVALLAARPVAEPSLLVLQDVSVLDGTGRAPRPHQDVLVAGGRIRAIVPHRRNPVPDGARRLPLPGRTVIPGLVDLHAHVTFLRDPVGLRGYDRGTSEQVLKILLAFGITTVRNPQAPTTEGVALREELRRGVVTGPRLFTAGDSLNWRDGSPDRVRAEVRRQAAAGVDFVKLYASMPPALVKDAIEQAHRGGVKVIGHLQTTPWDQAVGFGIDALTHGSSWSREMLPPARRADYDARVLSAGPLLARLDWLEQVDLDSFEVRTVIGALARHRTVVDPTLVAYDTKFQPQRYAGSPDIRWAPAALRAAWPPGGATSNWSDADFRRARAVWPKALALVKAYHDAGVLLAAGSDLPNPYVVPGTSLHRELELLVDCGLSPLQAITLATRNGAAGLGSLDDFGTVEEGKAADLVILSADPSEDIRNTRRIELVVQGGRVLDPAVLLAEAGVGR